MPQIKKPKLVQVKRKLTGSDAKRLRERQERRIAEIHAQQQNQAQAAERRSAAAARTRRGFAFGADDAVLLVGEGNFSFAASVAVLHASGAEKNGGSAAVGEFSITATSLDSEETVRTKYPDASGHISSVLCRKNAQILFDVDATKLSACKPIRGRKFTKIVFNFPHTGAGIKDQDRNVLANQTLLSGFFLSAASMLVESDKPAVSAANHDEERSDQEGSDHDEIDHEENSKTARPLRGLIFVTLKTGAPYDLWDVKQVARACGLRCVQSFGFRPEEFPGYSHRRTIGFEEGLSVGDNSEITKRPSRTFVFAVGSTN